MVRVALLSPLFLAAAAAVSHAAPISFNGGSYTQNFDSYAGPTAGVNWTDTETIPGWYAFGSTTTSTNFVNGSPTTIYRAGGTGGLTGFYLWRTPASSTDVAFGVQNLDGSGSYLSNGYQAYGLALTNNTGNTLTSFSLGYHTERWAHGTNQQVADTVEVSYGINATGIGDAQGTWNATSLGFSSISDGVGTVAANLIVTPVDPLGTVTGLAWAPGETLFVRWRDPNIASSDRGIGIDDVAFTAWGNAFTLHPTLTGTADVTVDVQPGAPALHAIPGGEQTVGSTTIGINPASTTTPGSIKVAIDLEGDANDIAAVIAALGLSASVDPVFGTGYDAQVFLTGFQAGLYNLNYDLTGTGVTINGIAVVPEPTTLAGLAVSALLLRRRR